MDQMDLEDPELYINRELSHLNFHLRVLQQARNPQIPLLERLKFLLIFAHNLDEFFEIRVAGVKKQLAYGQASKSPDGLRLTDVLHRINEVCHQALQLEYSVLNDQLLPAMREEGIYFLRRSEWSTEQSVWVQKYFRDQVLPVMSPIGLDPAHPFPRLANKTLNFIVALEGKDAFGRQSGLAIVPAPRSLPRIIRFPDAICKGGCYFAFLSAMIHAHVDDLFPGMTVQGCYQFRLTRNADLDLDEDLVEDLALALKGELLSRRYGDEVRLEIADNCPDELVFFLLKQFNLTQDDLYRIPGMVNLSRMMSVTGLDFPNLRYRPFSPGVSPAMSNDISVFELLRRQDILMYHPFESFQPVVDFLRQAARDPKVLAIKQTLYRTGQDSEIMDLLVEAARNGKEVTAVVELRARFDEESNLEGAARLQKAGAIVVYGIVGFKTHAKMILVVRREGDQIRRYLHLGTGNYHIGNARIYTDFSLLTQDEDLAKDVHQVFQQLTGMGRAAKLKSILHAPFTLHQRLIELIELEIKAAREGKKAHIMVKVNGLTERKMIQAFYRASQAGVKVDLIVRGICALKPGVHGVSDNIRVVSIVGRFLEHARVFYFCSKGKDLVFCSSADLMERNLFKRVETCFPIKDPALKKRVIYEGLQVYLNQAGEAWELDSQACYQALIETHPDCQSAQQALLDQLSG